LSVPGPIEDVQEVRVLEWHVEPGRPFAAGDLIVELETYKAVVEVRSGREGVLREILCEAGDWQRVGGPLAVLCDNSAEPLPSSPDALPAWLVEFEVS
jgi:pyruvate/2-oxoglutarate dehydrogenase complex dihydrolipoamide acyltransferase (E2) component